MSDESVHQKLFQFICDSRDTVAVWAFKFVRFNELSDQVFYGEFPNATDFKTGAPSAPSLRLPLESKKVPSSTSGEIIASLEVARLSQPTTIKSLAAKLTVVVINGEVFGEHS
ncbi:MAG TPA: hypothetical protein VIM61_11340 [Chthoniobacterales bacterium]